MIFFGFELSQRYTERERDEDEKTKGKISEKIVF